MHFTAWLDRPLVFAHRGGAALGPENTMVAFDRGLACGADGLELDVRLSREGIAVVHHDETLDRTTSLTGQVRARTVEELTRAAVPTLADVLRRYPATPLIVELKESSSALAAAVVADVQRAQAVDRVCLGSFSVAALRQVRATEPSMATSAGRFEVRLALYRSWLGMTPGRVAYRALQVPERSGRTQVVSPRFVRLAHRQGLAVQVWTVDDADDIRRLLGWGVDGIISDRPDVAAEVVGAWEHERRVDLGRRSS